MLIVFLFSFFHGHALYTFFIHEHGPSFHWCPVNTSINLHVIAHANLIFVSIFWLWYNEIYLVYDMDGFRP